MKLFKSLNLLMKKISRSVMTAGNQQQYQMITENINAEAKRQSSHSKGHRLFRIVKEAKSNLVISDGKEQLMFKKYLVQDERVCKHLQKRFHLKHDSLIQIKNIEYAIQKNQLCADSEDLYCGVLFEKYVKTMEESIKENIVFSHEEVISTLTPIKEVIDYMVHQNYDPGELSSSSIVCTQDYQIKFIDSILHETSLIFRDRQSFTTNIYSELAEIMFSLLFPSQKHVKSWKKRYQIAKQRLDEADFHFFQEVYKKFSTISAKSSKSRKIKKQQNAKIISNKISQKSDIDSPKKSLHEVIVSCQSGKQNLIIQ